MLGFGRSENGNIALTTAVGMGVLLLAASEAVNLHGHVQHKQVLQDRLDSAVLGAAVVGHTDSDSYRDHVAGSLSDLSDSGTLPPEPELSVAKGADRMDVRLDAPYSVPFPLFGEATRPVTVEASTNLPAAGTLDLVLSLDFTGSMEAQITGTMIKRGTAMKAAAGDLVSYLETLRQGGNIRIGMVPFARHVRLPADQRDKPWTDRSNVDPATWNGCVGTEMPFDDTQAWLNMSRQVPAFHSLGGYTTMCSDEMIPPTQNFRKIRDGLDGATFDGDTHTISGLRWGWRMLDGEAPLENDRAANPGHRRALVLLSDGSNNTYPDVDGLSITMTEFKDRYGENEGRRIRNEKSAENWERLERTCQAIRASGVELYVISYTIQRQYREKLVAALESCAGSEDRFFYAMDADDIQGAFEDVGRSLFDIRLMR